MNLRMQYPEIGHLGLCDGTIHNIIPLYVYRFVYRGVEMFLFEYFDKNYSKRAQTFLIFDGRNYRKIPLNNYPDTGFLNNLELVGIPIDNIIASNLIRLENSVPYEDLDEFVSVRLGRIPRPIKKESLPQEPIAIATTQLPPDPPVPPKFPPEKEGGATSDYIKNINFTKHESYSEVTRVKMPCIALADPNKRSITFYNFGHLLEVEGSFTLHTDGDYLMGNLPLGQYGSPVEYDSQEEYDNACKNIKVGVAPAPYGQSLVPIYFTDSYKFFDKKDDGFLARNVDNNFKEKLNFISNRFYFIPNRRENKYIDNDYAEYLDDGYPLNYSMRNAKYIDSSRYYNSTTEQNKKEDFTTEEEYISRAIPTSFPNRRR